MAYPIRNTIVLADIKDELQKIPEDTFDLIITSPPYAGKRKDSYDNIPISEYADWLVERTKGFLNRIKPTGSVVINIKEGVVNGRRETYVLEYLLQMAKCGYWSETYIWNKTNPFPTGNKKRLKDAFEYCFHFTKSKDFKFYPENCLVPANPKWVENNKKRKNKGEHNTNNKSGMNMAVRTCSDMARPSNVITCPTNTINIGHPATFHINIPKFFINLMTEKGDFVFDPFMGSGTTALACKELGRDFYGVDKEKKYVNMSKERLL